ncbi:hypothetical protein KFL_002390040 [Klebsormidium nitens]|uniref:Uncharacterized protein n=1 Tax=Klebsormidium nitens TaxID=105231 RepID=A0A1Y1I8P5_KLENI|nr:hypothetical protein KFL_002390040 [Klebsormidium nitens]|eukprot:GAQ85511.1 hypothetical protein KFL_002390040 [Klebsormidium nitens]
MDKLNIIRQYASDRLDSQAPPQFSLVELEAAILWGGGKVVKGVDKQLLKKAFVEISEDEQELPRRRARARAMLLVIDADTANKLQRRRDRYQQAPPQQIMQAETAAIFSNDGQATEEQGSERSWPQMQDNGRRMAPRATYDTHERDVATGEIANLREPRNVETLWLPPLTYHGAPRPKMFQNDPQFPPYPQVFRPVPVNQEYFGPNGARLGDHNKGNTKPLWRDPRKRPFKEVGEGENEECGWFEQPVKSQRNEGVENSGGVRAKRRLELGSGTFEASAKRGSDGVYEDMPPLEPVLDVPAGRTEYEETFQVVGDDPRADAKHVYRFYESRAAAALPRRVASSGPYRSREELYRAERRPGNPPVREHDERDGSTVVSGGKSWVKNEAVHQTVYDPRDVRAFPGSEVFSQRYGSPAGMYREERRPDLAQGLPEDERRRASWARWRGARNGIMTRRTHFRRTPDRTRLMGAFRETPLGAYDRGNQEDHGARGACLREKRQ